MALDDAQVQGAMLARLDSLVALARNGAGGAGGATTPRQTYIWTARDETVGDEALTVTLPATPGAGERWIISRLTLHGVCAVTPINSQSPITGLFLVPVGTIEESLADGQGTVGWNIAARGIPLPAGVVVNATFIPTSNTYAYVISLTQSSPLILTAGQTLRGVISCNPGTLTPGPGAGSWGVLTAMGEIVRPGGATP